MKKFIYFSIILIFFNHTGYAQWQQASGTIGTCVISLTSNASHCIAGSWGNGVLQSLDNGNSWATSSAGLTCPWVCTVLAIDSIVYAGTFGGSAIFQSIDNGSNWSVCNNGITDTLVYSLIKQSGNVFCGINGGGGVFRTTTGNCNWIPKNNSGVGDHVLGMANKDDTIFAGTLSGIFMSSDSGASWTNISNGITGYNAWAFAFLGSNIFASMDTGGIFRTSDLGNTWLAVNNGLPTQFSIRSLTVNGSVIFATTAGAGLFM